MLTLIGLAARAAQSGQPRQNQEIRLNGITIRASPDGRSITIELPTGSDSSSGIDSSLLRRPVANEIYPVHRDLILRANQQWWNFVVTALDGVRYVPANYVRSGDHWVLGYAEMQGSQCVAVIAAGRSDVDVVETIVHEAAHCFKKGTPKFYDQNYAYNVQRNFRRDLDKR